MVLTASAEINRYGYGANNPINAIDPHGMQAFVEYSEANQAESSRTTIAVSRIQLTDGTLQEIVSVNGQAGKDIAAKIAQAAARYGARFVSPASLAEHAEIALYNYAKGSEAFRAIGISNWGGACPACTGFFRTVGDIGLYWIKQFTFGYFP